jgi:hypothetical protein
MRKLSKLLFALLMLYSFSASAQTTTTLLRDHYQACASATTYDDQALDEGFPAGTWGPGDNPNAPPDRVFISHHGLRLRVPNNLSGTLSVKGIYLWFAPSTRIVGQADQFAFRIFRVNGNSLQPVGSKNFKLSDFAGLGTTTAPDDPRNYLPLNITGINAGDELVFALETKTTTSDDVIAFYYTLPAGENPCGNVPSGWHVFLNDATNGQLLPGIPPLFDSFFNLKSSKTSEPVAGNPVFLPEIGATPSGTSETKVTVCQGECVTLNPTAVGGANRYTWTPRTALTTPDAIQTQACPRRSGQYIREALDAAGNILQRDTVTVEVKEKPIATVVVPGGPTQFCVGQTVNLRVEGKAGYTYQWYRDGKAIPGATNTTLADNPTATALYSVEVDNGGCKQMSLATLIRVLPGVNFRITGWPFMCGTGRTDFKLKGDFLASQNFTWTGGPPNVTDNDNPALGQNVSVSPATTTTYTVSATSIEGCTTQKRVVVRVVTGNNPVGAIYDQLDYETATFTPVRTTVCNNEEPFVFRVGPQRPFGTLTWTPNIPGLITEVKGGDDNEYLFDPSKVTSNQSVTIRWQGTYNTCPFNVTHQIAVTAVQIPRFGGVTDLICLEAPFTRTFTVTAGGGAWELVRRDGTPVTAGFTPNSPNPTSATLNIQTAGNDCYILRYRGTNQNCPYVAETTFCIIGQNETAVLTGIPNPLCTTDGIKEVTASIPGGTFSGLGIVSPTVKGKANFDPKAVFISPDDDNLSEKTVTITYSGTQGSCTVSGTLDVRVLRSDLRIAGLPADFQFCTVSNPIPFTVVPATVTVSCSGAQFVTRDTNDPTKYTFNSANATAGQYQLCFRGITETGCRIDSVITITITRPPDVVQFINLPNTVCSNVNPFPIFAVPAGGVPTSSLTPKPGTQIIEPVGQGYQYNPANIEFDPNTPIGSSVLDNITYAGRFGGCDYSITQPMTVIYVPGVRYNGLPPEICLTDPPFCFTITPRGGRLTAPFSFQQLNDTTYCIDPRAIGLGQYTLTYEGRISICDYKDVRTLRIDPPVDPAEIRIQVGTNPPNPPFICSTAGDVELIGLNPTGGTFEGSGVRQVGTQFFLDPACKGCTEEQRRNLGKVIYRGKRGGCNYAKEFNIVIDVVGEGIINLPTTVCLQGTYPVVFSPNGGKAQVIVNGNVVDEPENIDPFIFHPSDYLTGAGEITVRYFGTTPSGCNYDTSLVVTVTLDVTSAAINGLSSAYCANSPAANLTAVPEGGSFYVKGASIVDELQLNAGVLDIPFIFATYGTGTYTLEYRGTSSGCAIFSSNTFEIRSAPRINLTADKTNLCVNNSATLTLLPIGPEYAYEWYHNGELISGAVFNQYRITGAQKGDAGKYTGKVIDRNSGCSAELTIQINVSESQLEWDDRETETYAQGPTPSGNGGCNNDGYILATVKERFPGERFEFFINGKGPYSSGLNFIEIYEALDPTNPDFRVTGGKYTIRAVDAGGCEIETTLVVLAKCCPLPEDVAIANIEPKDPSFALVWEPRAGIMGFEVQVKRQEDTEWSATVTRLSNERTVSFDNLNPIIPIVSGGTYCVRIRSVCEGTELGGEVYDVSEWVERCVFLTEDCPTLINNPRVGEVTTSTAVISWDAMPGVVGYVVRYTDLNSGTTEERRTEETTIELVNLVPDKSYQVSVATDCGGGLTSPEVFEFFTTLDVCSAPNNIRIDFITSRSARASWDAVPGVTSYDVQLTNLDNNQTVSFSTTTAFMDLDSLECGTSYTVQIRSYCGGSINSDFTPGDFFTTLACCRTVDNITDAQTATTITLDWDDVPSATSYYVTYEEQGGGTQKGDEMTFTSDIVLTGLKLTTDYMISIYTICGADTSAPAKLIRGTNADCPAPINVEVRETSPSTGRIVWEAPVGIKTFIVEWRISGNLVWASQTVNNATEFTIANLQRGTTYEVQVRSQCAPGAESVNIPTTFTTETVCGAPSNVIVSNVQPTTATVTWSAGIGATSYVIRYRTTTGGQWQTRTTSATSIQLLSLVPNSEYEVQVRTQCGPVDVSAFTASSFFFTPQGVSCGIPTGLGVNNITQTTANLFWATVPNATSYEIYYREFTNTQYQITNATQNFRPITGLKAGTDYRVKIRSVCGTVFGDFTQEFAFRTPSAKAGFDASEAVSYTVYPNPTRGNVTVSFTAETEQNLSIRLVDVTGREIYRGTFRTSTGEQSFDLPIADRVTTGIYTLFMDLGESRQTTKLVVE